MPKGMSAKKSWYAITNKTADSADVEIYDEIGGGGISAKEFIKGLKDLEGKHLNLRINSPGGSIIDGQAIISALSRHTAGFTAWVEGLAASMASVIACAADKCFMAEGSMMMVHRAAIVSVGDAETLRKDASLLEKFEKGLLNIYAKKTGMEFDALEKMMADETWMDATEAVAFGFADGITDNTPAMASLSSEAMRQKFDTLISNMAKKPKAEAEAPETPVVETPVVEEPTVTEPAPVVEEPAVEPAPEPSPDPEQEAPEPVTEPVALASEALIAKFDAIKAERDQFEAKVGELNAKCDVLSAALSAERENIARLESSLGLSAAAVVPPIGAHNDATPSLLEQFNAIADPAERTAFYRQNAAALKKLI
jgi:ATP-dependent protease ClpP protease subunit